MPQLSYCISYGNKKKKKIVINITAVLSDNFYSTTSPLTIANK